jgi:hypothetical protein
MSRSAEAEVRQEFAAWFWAAARDLEPNSPTGGITRRPNGGDEVGSAEFVNASTSPSIRRCSGPGVVSDA